MKGLFTESHVGASQRVLGRLSFSVSQILALSAHSVNPRTTRDYDQCWRRGIEPLFCPPEWTGQPHSSLTRGRKGKPVRYRGLLGNLPRREGKLLAVNRQPRIGRPSASGPRADNDVVSPPIPYLNSWPSGARADNWADSGRQGTRISASLRPRSAPPEATWFPVLLVGHV